MKKITLLISSFILCLNLFGQTVIPFGGMLGEVTAVSPSGADFSVTVNISDFTGNFNGNDITTIGDGWVLWGIKSNGCTRYEIVSGTTFPSQAIITISDPDGGGTTGLGFVAIVQESTVCKEGHFISSGGQFPLQSLNQCMDSYYTDECSGGNTSIINIDVTDPSDSTLVNNELPSPCPDGAIAIYVGNGTVYNPDYVWQVYDDNGNCRTIEIESPAVSEFVYECADTLSGTGLQIGDAVDITATTATLSVFDGANIPDRVIVRDYGDGTYLAAHCGCWEQSDIAYTGGEDFYYFSDEVGTVNGTGLNIVNDTLEMNLFEVQPDGRICVDIKAYRSSDEGGSAFAFSDAGGNLVVDNGDGTQFTQKELNLGEHDLTAPNFVARQYNGNNASINWNDVGGFIIDYDYETPNFNTIFNDTGNEYLLRSNLKIGDGVAANRRNAAILGNIDINTDNDFLGVQAGVYSLIHHYGDGTINFPISQYNIVQNDGIGRFEFAHGAQTFLSNTSTGSMNYAYGYRSGHEKGAGTISNYTAFLNDDAGGAGATNRIAFANEDEEAYSFTDGQWRIGSKANLGDYLLQINTPATTAGSEPIRALGILQGTTEDRVWVSNASGVLKYRLISDIIGNQSLNNDEWITITGANQIEYAESMPVGSTTSSPTGIQFKENKLSDFGGFLERHINGYTEWHNPLLGTTGLPYARIFTDADAYFTGLRVGKQYADIATMRQQNLLGAVNWSNGFDAPSPTTFAVGEKIHVRISNQRHNAKIRFSGLNVNGGEYEFVISYYSLGAGGAILGKTIRDVGSTPSTANIYIGTDGYLWMEMTPASGSGSNFFDFNIDLEIGSYGMPTNGQFKTGEFLVVRDVANQ